MRISWFAALAALSGCSEYNLETTDGTDVFVQEPAEKVDILLVVDNSGSMASYQEQLGSSFNAFITYFVGANVDYHIAITTTDIDLATQAPYTGCPHPTPPARGAFVGEIIDNDTPDPESVFQDEVNVGTCGSPVECGLEGARLALSEDMLADDNRGFLRDDADLSIIFVSDEEDSSPDPVNDYINDFFDVKGQRTRNVFNASALTVTNQNECTANQAAASSSGDRYIDVADQTHGLVENLCDQDFEHIVTDLSLNASRLTDTFFLLNMPDPGSITVTVDQTDIPCTLGDWTYDLVEQDGKDKPAIIFDSDKIPTPGQRIAVHYNYGDGDPSQFCQGGP
jgi:hypothetical protein